MPYLRLALAALPFVTFAACGGGSSDDHDAAPSIDATSFDAMPSPSCLEAVDHSDLAWIQDNVFTPSCANFSACHDASRPEADLDLTTLADAEAGLIDVDSDLEPTMKRVVPGDPEASYLMVILGQFGVDDSRLDPEVGTMPLNNALLCHQKRDAIARWIESLAADAGPL